MINTTVTYIPAYTTREFRNFGTHKANEFYKYTFTISDITLANNGAIKLFPTCMCEYRATKEVNLNSVIYKADEKINPDDYPFDTLKVLIKTHVLYCDFKPEFKKLDETKLIKLARLYECVGKTFKTISTELDIDFEDVKKALDLKQGGANKKAKFEDVQKIQKLLEV